MKKRKTKRSEESDPPLSAEEQAEMAWGEDYRREQEARYSHLQQLSKDELIQLVIDVQAREEDFATWLLSNSKGLIAYDPALQTFKEAFDRLRELEYRRTKNQKKGRRAQADKAAAKEEMKALGVDDYYGLLREAIMLLNENPKLQENRPTKVAAIRAIIVTLLCEPSRSRHTYDQTEWVRIIRTIVTPGHVGTAENQLKRKNPTSF